MSRLTKIFGILLLFVFLYDDVRGGRIVNPVDYVKSRNFVSPESKSGLVTEIKNNTLTEEDFIQICQAGTGLSLTIRDSTINKGAIKGLRDCSKLEQINYHNTIIDPDDIPSHNLNSNIRMIGIEGGDQYLFSLAKLNLKHFSRISINGNITNMGVLNFLKQTDLDISGQREDLSIYGLHKKVEGIILSIGGNKLTNEIFDYFINLKGLRKLYIIGVDGCKITEKAASVFNDKYEKKYGISGVMAYIWPEECPKE